MFFYEKMYKEKNIKKLYTILLTEDNKKCIFKS